MRRVPVFVGVVVATIFAAAILWRYAHDWHPAADRFAVQGFSVSAADGTVDWPTVRARGADFVFIVASAGATRDPAFEANWGAAGHAGLHRGAIHRFSLCDPTADQLTAYLTTVPRSVDALPAALALDFDESCTARPTRAQVLTAIRGFLAPAEYHDGREMMLRISPAFEADYQISEAVLRPLWAERNFFAPDYLARPWRLWQATTVRRIDGIAGPVSWSVAAP